MKDVLLGITDISNNAPDIKVLFGTSCRPESLKRHACTDAVDHRAGSGSRNFYKQKVHHDGNKQVA